MKTLHILPDLYAAKSHYAKLLASATRYDSARRCLTLPGGEQVTVRTANEAKFTNRAVFDHVLDLRRADG